MINPINFLPEDLFIYLLEFLKDEEQIRLMDCSINYNKAKKAVRKVDLSQESLIRCNEDKDYLAKIFSLIEDPGRQITILGSLTEWNFTTFPFQRLFFLSVGNLEVLLKLLAINNEMKIRRLDCCGHFPEHVQLPFPQISCMHFMFQIRNNVPITLPVSHLQCLTLVECKDIDVTSFGSIPELHLFACTNLRGLSNLKNNSQVYFHFLFKEVDLSGAFTNCKTIELNLSPSFLILDLTLWKKVRNLKLGCFAKQLSLKSNHLPPSVRRCCLIGSFIDTIEWKPFVHQLTELSLKRSDHVTSLKGLGLDTISVLRFYELPNLVSLEGLGGKNRKVTVISCANLVDFSAINSVDTVTIKDCLMFKDVGQVSGVRELVLSDLPNPERLGKTIEVFSIEASFPKNFQFELFVDIPHLIFLIRFEADVVALKLHLLMKDIRRFRNQTISLEVFVFSEEQRQIAKSLYSYCLTHDRLNADYHSFMFQQNCTRVIRLVRKHPE